MLQHILLPLQIPCFRLSLVPATFLKLLNFASYPGVSGPRQSVFPWIPKAQMRTVILVFCASFSSQWEKSHPYLRSSSRGRDLPQGQETVFCTGVGL